MLIWLAAVLAYALGSIPFSLIVAKRVKGINLLEHGSGNLGATNVYRTLGPGWGVLVHLKRGGRNEATEVCKVYHG